MKPKGSVYFVDGDGNQVTADVVLPTTICHCLPADTCDYCVAQRGSGLTKYSHCYCQCPNCRLRNERHGVAENVVAVVTEPTADDIRRANELAAYKADLLARKDELTTLRANRSDTCQRCSLYLPKAPPTDVDAGHAWRLSMCEHCVGKDAFTRDMDKQVVTKKKVIPTNRWFSGKPPFVCDDDDCHCKSMP